MEDAARDSRGVYVSLGRGSRSVATHSTSYWFLVEPIWLRLNESWDGGPELFLSVFREVDPAAGHLYAAHWCQSEVCNGGLLQFFWNTAGLLCPEAIAGFRAIGLGDLANTVKEAASFFGEPYPRERAARRAFLSPDAGSYASGKNAFEPMDERFYEALGTAPNRWELAANAFAVRHGHLLLSRDFGCRRAARARRTEPGRRAALTLTVAPRRARASLT